MDRPDVDAADAEVTGGISRRDLIIKGGSLAALAWAAPAITRLPKAYAATTPPTAPATGGEEDTFVDDGGTTWRLHAFTSAGTGTFTVAADSLPVEYLVVAGGGGGGGSKGGGGGGAGGLIEGSNSFSAGGYTVDVGDGGGTNANGGDSSFDGAIASGGGGGGGLGEDRDGGDGGSGGGGGHRAASAPAVGSGIQASPGLGNGGGVGSTENPYIAGGGGGAGAAGFDGAEAILEERGAGGSGVDRSADYGSTYGEGGWFAGGGGGDKYELATRSFDTDNFPAPGGRGGGGSGAIEDGAPQNGSPNTGGGGGGADDRSAAANGSQGGSGIVIIRYQI